MVKAKSRSSGKAATSNERTVLGLGFVGGGLSDVRARDDDAEARKDAATSKGTTPDADEEEPFHIVMVEVDTPPVSPRGSARRQNAKPVVEADKPEPVKPPVKPETEDDSDDDMPSLVCDSSDVEEKGEGSSGSDSDLPELRAASDSEDEGEREGWTGVGQ